MYKILITAGPTREYLDPVRYLSNPSSGAMGIAIADELARRGARVTLVLGPTPLRPSEKIQLVPVVTGREMFRDVKKRLSRADAFIATAAVCDWRFETGHRRKLKKGLGKTISVRLVRNPDILAEAGRIRLRRPPRRTPLRVGFALETDHAVPNALKKMREKNLDLIIANDPRSFSSHFIKPIWIERSSRPRRYPRMTKKSLSSKIAGWLAAKLKNDQSR